MSDAKLSRIDKMFVDRDGELSADARERRSRFAIVMACGEDVATSRILQLSVLTACAIAGRCFPNAVSVALPPGLAEVPSLAWPGLQQSFGEALRESAFVHIISFENVDSALPCLVFGNVPHARGLRVTYDGWIVRVGPVDRLPRSGERPYNPLAGILAAALAVSELFSGFAEMSVEAGRRVVALSLWRPDLSDDDPRAVGPVLEYLPRRLWVLGLGHLGTGYLWALASLPYVEPKSIELSLLDFDSVEVENYETGLLFRVDDERRYKTRVCNDWLERRNFCTKLVERRFDEQFRVQEKEPKVALCGFDSNPARHHLVTANFVRVFESGLGGTSANFDTIGFHALPNRRSPSDLWPVLSDTDLAEQNAEAERQARDNPGYKNLGEDDCGRALLAGTAVAVPFVGIAAAALVVSELLRVLHEGTQFTDAKLRVGNIAARSFRPVRDYTASDLIGIDSAPAKFELSP